MTAQLFDYFEDVSRASTPGQAAAIYIDMMERTGAPVVNMFMGTDYSNQYASNLPDWHIEEQYNFAPDIADAHMIRNVIDGVPAVYWGTAIDDDLPNVTDAGRIFSSARSEFRQRSAVTYSLPDLDGGFSGAGIGFGYDEDGDTFRIRMHESGGSFAVAAFAVHAHIQKLMHLQSEPSPLSVRQTDVLALMASGLRIGEIADRLGISEAAVSLYLSNLKTKLNVRTKEQALAMAVAHGWVKL